MRGGLGGGFWWGACGVGQLVLATAAYRRGCGDALMPLKAFGVASLYVGAGACALGGALHLSGIKQVGDLVRIGESIRKILGAPPRNHS
ncbi:hypothetical protein KI387_009842, partial [Taxus chinensis]